MKFEVIVNCKKIKEALKRKNSEIYHLRENQGELKSRNNKDRPLFSIAAFDFIMVFTVALE